MHPNLLRLAKAHYKSTKMRITASNGASMSLEIQFSMQFRWTLFTTLFNFIIDYQGV